jgi:hypothetical protein
LLERNTLAEFALDHQEKMARCLAQNIVQVDINCFFDRLHRLETGLYPTLPVAASFCKRSS